MQRIVGAWAMLAYPLKGIMRVDGSSVANELDSVFKLLGWDVKKYASNEYLGVDSGGFKDIDFIFIESVRDTSRMLRFLSYLSSKNISVPTFIVSCQNNIKYITSLRHEMIFGCIFSPFDSEMIKNVVKIGIRRHRDLQHNFSSVSKRMALACEKLLIMLCSKNSVLKRLAWQYIKIDYTVYTNIKIQYGLTNEETFLMFLIKSGVSTKELSDVFDKSESTIYNTRKHIRKKLSLTGVGKSLHNIEFGNDITRK